VGGFPVQYSDGAWFHESRRAHVAYVERGLTEPQRLQVGQSAYNKTHLRTTADNLFTHRRTVEVELWHFHASCVTVGYCPDGSTILRAASQRGRDHSERIQDKDWCMTYV
jgi:hypothetical protein